MQSDIDIIVVSEKYANNPPPTESRANKAQTPQKPNLRHHPTNTTRIPAKEEQATIQRSLQTLDKNHAKKEEPSHTRHIQGRISLKAEAERKCKAAHPQSLRTQKNPYH